MKVKAKGILWAVVLSLCCMGCGAQETPVSPPVEEPQIISAAEEPQIEESDSPQPWLFPEASPEPRPSVGAEGESGSASLALDTEEPIVHLWCHNWKNELVGERTFTAAEAEEIIAQYVDPLTSDSAHPHADGGAGYVTMKLTGSQQYGVCEYHFYPREYVTCDRDGERFWYLTQEGIYEELRALLESSQPAEE